MKRHILIIDSEPYFRHVAAFMLRNAGYTVSSASTAEQASALLFSSSAKKRPYDLIFADTHLPGINTLELSEALRRENLNAPMLTVGGFTDKSFVLEMLNSGHHEFLENIFAATDINRSIEKKHRIQLPAGPKKPTVKKLAKTAQRSTNR